jgi:hypothetical protein
MSEALHGAFTEALAEPVPVEQWRDRAENYGRDYMTLGASTLSAMLVADLVRLQQFVNDPRVWAAGRPYHRTRPATLPRFATHIELHGGLMLAKSGDKAGGLAYARTALDRLPPERHSLSLRLLTDEIERSR